MKKSILIMFFTIFVIFIAPLKFSIINKITSNTDLCYENHCIYLDDDWSVLFYQDHKKLYGFIPSRLYPADTYTDYIDYAKEKLKAEDFAYAIFNEKTKDILLVLTHAQKNESITKHCTIIKKNHMMKSFTWGHIVLLARNNTTNTRSDEVLKMENKICESFS